MQKKLYLASLLSGILAASPLATARAVGQGSNLDIQVMDGVTGTTLSGVAVCLGTAADTAQFGSLTTDARGMTRFRAVPASPVQVTVSHPGYQAEVRVLDSLFQDRMLIFKMASGWHKGPVCNVSSITGASASELVITSIDLDVSDLTRGRVRVMTRVKGEASEIRISDSPDFSGAGWQSYKPAVDYQPDKTGNKQQLYVQVRRYAKVNGASLQSLSPVASARFMIVQ